MRTDGRSELDVEKYRAHGLDIRLRRATQALCLNAKVRATQRQIIRNTQVNLDKKNREIDALKAELALEKGERQRYQTLAFERKAEVEQLKDDVAHQKARVTKLSNEYLAYHRLVRERERKRAKKRNRERRLEKLGRRK